jgi:hypothetical protein
VETEATIKDQEMIYITVFQGDTSLATALAAGRMMLQSAPLLTSCQVAMIGDNCSLKVTLFINDRGNITESYDAQIGAYNNENGGLDTPP